MYTTPVNGNGTIDVMNWIAEHNAPELYSKIFSYNGNETFIVTFISDDSSALTLLLKRHPLDEWDSINNMKRLYSAELTTPAWYFYINHKFYFATPY
jgi:hypothetical protein